MSVILCGNKAIRSCHWHNQSPGNSVLHHDGNVQTSYFAYDKYITLRVGIMPCSRRRRYVSQIEDYNIFKLVFRGGAYSHQGLPGAGDLHPSCRHGDHQRTSYSCKGTHSGDCCCSYSLSRHKRAGGGQAVDEIVSASKKKFYQGS